MDMAVFDGIEVSNDRVIAHPPERVYGAFADPEQLIHWWGPDGFTNSVQAFDLRPGGAFRITMHNSRGQHFDNDKTFHEVTPQRIVLEHHQPMHHFLMTMTFDPHGADTRLGWHMQFARPESGDDQAELARFLHAANEQNFNRLEAFLNR